jgi:hypothetical protein
MAHQFTTSYLKDAIDLFRYYKRLGDNAIAQCPEDKLCAEIDPESNSVAIIVKHMAGNMRSRWSDFLTTDGDNRQIAHYSYHVGQIVFLARHFAGSDWRTLTIAKKKSGEFNAQVASGEKSQR